jgi:PAS domain S-box-containing protein
MVAALVLAGILIFGGGFSWYATQRAATVKDERASLTAIAALKAGQIAQWRAERISDGLFLTNDYLANRSLAAFLAGRPSAPATSVVQAWLGALTVNGGYTGGWVLDTAGRERLATTSSPVPTRSAAVGREVMASGVATLTDFYLDGNGVPAIDLVAPLWPAAGSAGAHVPVGAVVLRADPQRLLYPLVQTWPTPSASAETLLFERDGTHVLYLNELRHRTGTALKLRLPDVSTLAAGAALRGAPIGDFLDYRGVPVVAAARAVAGSPWMVIAKIDRTEAYGALDASATSAVLLGIAAMALATAVIVLAWRAQAQRARTADAEARLARQELEVRYGAVMESANDAILVADGDGTIIEANDSAGTMLGVEAPALAGCLLDTLVVAAERPDFRKVMAALEPGQSALVEAQIDYPGPEPLWAEMSLRRVSEGADENILVVARDVTDRRRAEKVLRKSETAYRELLANLPAGVVVHAPDTSIVLSNPLASELLGLTPDQLAGKTAMDPAWHFIDEDSVPLPLEGLPVNRVLSSGRELSALVVGVCRSDRPEPVWLICNGFPVHGADGELVQAVIVFTEITDRVRAQEALKARGIELERSNQELERFAYVASHDLQEPLRMVASYTQLLKKRYGGQLDSDADEFIDYAVEGAVRLQGLINDLLEYSRLGSQGRDPTPTDAGAVLDRVVHGLSKTIESSGATVEHDPLPCLMVDPVQLGQLFQNLLANAMKFRSEAPPVVHVSANREGAMWRLDVRDNGIGIDPQYVDRVFVVFQRLYSRGEFEGSGIGLAICKRIVERHGGRIWIESTPGQGSEFLFTLPAADDEMEG